MTIHIGIIKADKRKYMYCCKCFDYPCLETQHQLCSKKHMGNPGENRANCGAGWWQCDSIYDMTNCNYIGERS